MDSRVLFLWLPALLLILRLTLLIRRRAAEEFMTVDSIAALQILLTMASFGAVLFLTNMRRFVSALSHGSMAGLVLFYALCVVSALWSPAPTFTGYRAVEFLGQALVIFAALQTARDLQQAERRIFAVIAAVVILDVVGTLKAAGGVLSVGACHSTSYGISAGMLACYAFGEALSGRRRDSRRLMTLGLVALGFVCLSTSSGSIIATAVGVAVVALLSRRPVLFAAMLAGALVLFALPQGQLQALFFPDKEAGMITTLSGRTAMWQSFIPLIKAQPLFGYGMSVAARFYGSSYNINCHNAWLAALLSTGLIGAGLLAGSVGWLFWRCFRAFQMAQVGALGCLGALTMALVNSNTFAFVGEDWCVPSFALVCFWAFSDLFVRPAQGRGARAGKPKPAGRLTTLPWARACGA